MHCATDIYYNNYTMHSIKQKSTNKLSKFYIFTILAIAPFILQAQLKADFKADDTLGCANANTYFTVHFTNLSTTTDPKTTWLWEYDGFTDTAKNPVYAFLNPGKYDIKLTITTSNNSTATVTKASYITISQPFPNFTASYTSACPR